MVCMAKLSRACGFTKRVSVDVSYLQINDILDENLPYMQSGCWHCQSNTSEMNSGNISLYNLG